MSFYSKNATEYIEESKLFDMTPFYSFVEKHFKFGTMLDFGFGSGRDMLYFKEKGFKISGMDACHEFVQNGKECGLDVDYGDAFSKLPISFFDCIYTVSTLMHIPAYNRELFLNNLTSKLNKNGLFFISYTEEYGRNTEKDFYPLKRDELSILKLSHIETIEIIDKRGVVWITSCYQNNL